MARKLVDSLHEEYDPGKRKDSYREAVLDMIDRKAAGKKPRKAKEKPPEETPDLMAALEASLAGKK
jgi:DNA end-binding protein Ku